MEVDSPLNVGDVEDESPLNAEDAVSDRDPSRMNLTAGLKGKTGE